MSNNNDSATIKVSYRDIRRNSSYLNMILLKVYVYVGHNTLYTKQLFWRTGDEINFENNSDKALKIKHFNLKFYSISCQCKV